MRLTLNAAPSRLSLSVLLAVPLVYALFLAASLLIKVDELVLTKAPERVLGAIIPASTIDDPLEPRPPVREMTRIDKPPPPPRPHVDTKGTVPGFSVPAPESGLFDLGDVKPPVVAVFFVAGRGITVVRAPAPSMPASALTRG